ncbi:hypothetical protein [Actinoplanes sp. NPDC023714]|uniref:hypothetical protein n=1 Tax=Actinoplanes sp. NPDC023714 TaxID=3154322 RepID=UPI0034110DE1
MNEDDPRGIVDEDDVRAAMRTTIARNPAPPPMTSASALAAARRSARRRNALAGAGAAVALAAVAFATVPLRDALGEPPMTAAGDGQPVMAPSAPVETPDPDDTKPSWPAEASGDATYDSGTHYVKGKRLLDEVLAIVPEGYTAPEMTTPEGMPSRYHQAAVEERGTGYSAYAFVAKGGGTGRILVEVRRPGDGLPGDPCELARSFWGMGGVCEVSTTGGERVGVVKSSSEERLDQWAAFRHEDGTVVFVAEARSADPSLPSLRDVPIPVQKLVDLATDERFLLQ